VLSLYAVSLAFVYFRTSRKKKGELSARKNKPRYCSKSLEACYFPAFSNTCNYQFINVLTFRLPVAWVVMCFTVVREQELSNLLMEKNYVKAIALAITLEQPLRVLNITKGADISTFTL